MSQVAGEPQAYLDHVVSLFNQAVREHDFSRFVDLFCDDAVLEFDGVPDPPLSGKPAIALRYRENAPDDEIRIDQWRTEPGRLVAAFRWRDIPEAIGGCFVIERRGDCISHLTVAYGGPATRCFK